MARNQPITEQRTTSRNLRVLTHLFGFLRPYRKNLAAALLALFIAAGALLGLAWCCNGGSFAASGYVGDVVDDACTASQISKLLGYNVTPEVRPARSLAALVGQRAQGTSEQVAKKNFLPLPLSGERELVQSFPGAAGRVTSGAIRYAH
jgi:hypothetical protein